MGKWIDYLLCRNKVQPIHVRGETKLTLEQILKDELANKMLDEQIKHTPKRNNFIKLPEAKPLSRSFTHY